RQIQDALPSCRKSGVVPKERTPLQSNAPALFMLPLRRSPRLRTAPQHAAVPSRQKTAEVHILPRMVGLTAPLHRRTRRRPQHASPEGRPRCETHVVLVLGVTAVRGQTAAQLGLGVRVLVDAAELGSVSHAAVEVGVHVEVLVGDLTIHRQEAVALVLEQQLSLSFGFHLLLVGPVHIVVAAARHAHPRLHELRPALLPQRLPPAR
ncbi:hypothetical protein BN1723_016582, partial [Verticillium longisporum]